MVASHTPPMRPGRGREAPPGRQGGSGVPGGVSGPRRSTGGTRARSGGGLDRRPAPLNRGRARTRHRGRPRRLSWTTMNINKPRARLGIGRVRSRAVCWLLKQARAAVEENEEAASSNRSRYEARHMPSAAMAGRAARAGRRPQAAQQQQRSAQKIVRHSHRCPTY